MKLYHVDIFRLWRGWRSEKRNFAFCGAFFEILLIFNQEPSFQMKPFLLYKNKDEADFEVTAKIVTKYTQYHL